MFQSWSLLYDELSWEKNSYTILFERMDSGNVTFPLHFKNI